MKRSLKSISTFEEVYSFCDLCDVVTHFMEASVSDGSASFGFLQFSNLKVLVISIKPYAKKLDVISVIVIRKFLYFCEVFTRRSCFSTNNHLLLAGDHEAVDSVLTSSEKQFLRKNFQINEDIRLALIL